MLADWLVAESLQADRPKAKISAKAELDLIEFFRFDTGDEPLRHVLDTRAIRSNAPTRRKKSS